MVLLKEEHMNILTLEFHNLQVKSERSETTEEGKKVTHSSTDSVSGKVTCDVSDLIGLALKTKAAKKK